MTSDKKKNVTKTHLQFSEKLREGENEKCHVGYEVCSHYSDISYNHNNLLCSLTPEMKKIPQGIIAIGIDHSHTPKLRL